MDNVTHTLTAIALSQTGLSRKTRFATLAIIIAANAPDVEVVTGFISSATYLKFHRGLTHSVLGVTVLAALVAAGIYFWKRRAGPAKAKDTPPLNLRWLFLICWIGTASHLLLDLTNSYGVRVFEPFSGRWYSWDIMYIMDPLLLTLFAVGLGTPLLFRIISEEVGARKPGYRKGAIFALGAMVMLWGLRGFAHRRALTLLDTRSYYAENPERLGAFPSPANPFKWTGIAETEAAYHVLPVNVLDSDIDMEKDRVFHKPQPSPAITMATKTRTAEIFLDFARFPWAQAEESDDGYEVRIEDLRFLPPTPRRHAFVAEIFLDKNLHVLSESFSFSGRGR